MAKTPGVMVPEYQAGSIVEMRINTTKKPLNDPKVRQALTYSFDYDQAVEGVMSGHARRMDSIVAAGMAGYYKPSFTYVKDLDKAHQLLTEAGYPDGGFALEYVWISGLERDRAAGRDVAGRSEEAGHRPQHPRDAARHLVGGPGQPRDRAADHDGRLGQDYADATQQVWAMYYSGNLPPAGSNYYFYKNETVDKLLEAARVEQDQAKRDELYQEAIELIYTDAPEVWVMQPTERIALRDNVKGYDYNFSYSYQVLPVRQDVQRVRGSHKPGGAPRSRGAPAADLCRLRSMRTYLHRRRLALLVFVLLGVSLLTFSISHVVPADPARLAAGPRATGKQVEALRQKMGFDRPLPEQYVHYLAGLAAGRLRLFAVQPAPGARRTCKDYFPATIELTLAAMAICLVVGIPLGVLSAVHRDTFDRSPGPGDLHRRRGVADLLAGDALPAGLLPQAGHLSRRACASPPA